MATTKQLWVPASFWLDHFDRCPADDPESEMCREVRRTRNQVLVECDEKQISCLRSDAEFYCDKNGPDEAPAFIRRSARATLAAIARATGAQS